MARAEKRKYHYIYKITCNITNRYYIGMHSTDDLDDGYFGSGKRLWFSIIYHGKENHVKEILEFCKSRKELVKREEELVTEELLDTKLSLNLVKGGQGGGGCSNFSEEKLLEFTKAGGLATAKKLETDLEFRKERIIRCSKQFKKCWSEGKLANTKRFLGKKHSDETKKLMRESAKGKHDGNKNSQYGTCWITREGVNKKIKKEDFEIYFKEGWVKGRNYK